MSYTLLPEFHSAARQRIYQPARMSWLWPKVSTSTFKTDVCDVCSQDIYMSVFYGTKVLRSNPPLCYLCLEKQASISFAPESGIDFFWKTTVGWWITFFSPAEFYIVNINILVFGWLLSPVRLGLYKRILFRHTNTPGPSWNRRIRLCGVQTRGWKEEEDKTVSLICPTTRDWFYSRSSSLLLWW